MGARILIALCGLLRTYRVAWPVLAEQLRLDALEADGIQVDVAVFTSLATRCADDDKARMYGLWPLCSSNLQREDVTDADVRAEVRATIGQRLRVLHDAHIPPKAREQGKALESRALDFVRFLANTTALAPNAAREASAARGFFGAYNVTLFIRPDVVLVPTSPLSQERAFAPFNLLKTAAAFPGFQIVGGSIWRHFFYHNRDWDLAHLLSSPVTVADWLLLEPSQDDSCSATGCSLQAPTSPRRPTGLTGVWVSAAQPGISTSAPRLKYCTLRKRRHALCDRALYFERRGLPMGALPEALALTHIVRLTEHGAARDGDLTPCVVGARDDLHGISCAAPNPGASCLPYVPAVLSGRALPELGVRLAVANASSLRRIRNLSEGALRANFVARELGWDSDAHGHVDWREYSCSKPARKARFRGSNTS
jgi:hypothetical protein